MNRFKHLDNESLKLAVTTLSHAMNILTMNGVPAQGNAFQVIAAQYRDASDEFHSRIRARIKLRAQERRERLHTANRARKAALAAQAAGHLYAAD